MVDKKRTRKWSAKVSETSDALDLEDNVFERSDPKHIATSLKKSAEASKRRKANPFRSAISMLTFYINRAGKNLSAAEKRRLEAAKEELRKESFGRGDMDRDRFRRSSQPPNAGLMVPEQGEQQDDRDRHPEQPEKNSTPKAHGSAPAFALSGSYAREPRTVPCSSGTEWLTHANTNSARASLAGVRRARRLRPESASRRRIRRIRRAPRW